MAKLYVTAEYKPTMWYKLGWDIELPDDYTADDVDNVFIKWSNEIWVTMKDDTEHLIKQYGDTLEEVDNSDPDAWKWSDNEQWSATGEHYNV